MSKVLGGVSVDKRDCLAALQLTDWTVHKVSSWNALPNHAVHAMPYMPCRSCHAVHAMPYCAITCPTVLCHAIVPSLPCGCFHCKVTFMWQNSLNFKSVYQCCGSGSTGSTCFWASRIRILLSSCKNSRKTLITTILWLFLSFYLWKGCKCTFKK